HVLEPLARRLGEHVHGYAFDERGHGDARTPVGIEFNWRGFADDALAAADALGLQRPFGFGHSAGGAALLMAEQLRPGTFRAIFCFEPIVIPVASPMGRGDNPLSEGAGRRPARRHHPRHARPRPLRPPAGSRRRRDPGRKGVRDDYVRPPWAVLGWYWLSPANDAL